MALEGGGKTRETILDFVEEQTLTRVRDRVIQKIRFEILGGHGTGFKIRELYREAVRPGGSKVDFLTYLILSFKEALKDDDKTIGIDDEREIRQVEIIFSDIVNAIETNAVLEAPPLLSEPKAKDSGLAPDGPQTSSRGKNFTPRWRALASIRATALALLTIMGAAAANIFPEEPQSVDPKFSSDSDKLVQKADSNQRLDRITRGLTPQQIKSLGPETLEFIFNGFDQDLRDPHNFNARKIRRGVNRLKTLFGANSKSWMSKGFSREYLLEGNFRGFILLIKDKKIRKIVLEELGLYSDDYFERLSLEER